MIFCIDQSGKIEQTNKNTVLCLANDKVDAVIIKAKTKRQLQEIFRRNGQIRNFVLFNFGAGIALLIKRNSNLGKVVVDREYYGKEGVIKEIILEILRDEEKIPKISFSNIGRRVNAHLKGYLIYKRKLKMGINLSKKEMLKAIKKTEVGKRLKDA